LDDAVGYSELRRRRLDPR